MFGMKKKLDLGILIGENRHNYLSFDEYTEHFLLPFSPRFTNIDFAVSSLSSIDIKNIVILAKRDKDIILNYVVKGWPSINFFVFDYIDIKEKFLQFVSEYTQEHSLELIVIMKGNFPVWFDMKFLKEVMEKSENIAIRTKYEKEYVFSGIVVEKNIFIKKYENLIFDESNLDVDIIQKITDEFKMHTIDASGYIMPFRSLKEYYNIHIDMLDDYLVFDRFNAYVPIRGDLAMNITSNLGRGSHIINSIMGENVEISGKIENSVIFSNVKVGRNAYIKNSLIFPGNHIGSNVQIINSIIDEFSEDNTLPNIEPYSVIGNDKPSGINEKFPDILNFGVTLIGKDARLPASTKIGANCYLDSFIPASVIRENKKINDGVSILRENP